MSDHTVPNVRILHTNRRVTDDDDDDVDDDYRLSTTRCDGRTRPTRVIAYPRLCEVPTHVRNA